MRAGGLEPPRGYPQRIFVPATAFAAPATRRRALRRVRGLDYPFTLPRPRIASGASRGLGAARLVSTPSRFRAWLGIAVERFPRVWAVLRPRFPAAHSNRFKSVASAIPPRPRGAKSYTQAARSRQGIAICAPHNGPCETSGSGRPVAFAAKTRRVCLAFAHTSRRLRRVLSPNWV